MKNKVLLSAITMALAHAAYAQAALPTVSADALPTNGSVVLGTAAVSVSGNTMTITAGVPGPTSIAAIVWGNQGGATLNPGASGGFDIGSAATVVFKATDVTSNVLNVDVSGNPSVIAGHLDLDSNNVFIANGNGVIVGPNAVIDISGLNSGGLGQLALIGDNIGTSATELQTVGSNIADILGGANQGVGGNQTSVGVLPLASGSVTIATGAFIGNNKSNDSPMVLVAGSDVNVDGSINADSVSFLTTGTNNTINIGSTGSVGASEVVSINPGVDNATTQNQYVSINDAGIMGAQYSMYMGGTGLYVSDITGSGSLAVGGLTIKNLIGSINNITSGQILANGFQLTTVPNTYDQIVIDAVGTQSQGINLKVNGSAIISTGNTVAVLPNGAAPANANSKLIVQATGTLNVENGGANGVRHADPYNPADNSFQFPGLIYLQSSTQLYDFNDDIVNAYTTNAPVGYGVFLIAPNISDTNPVYANGGRGVVFAAPFDGLYYPTATVNGSGANAGMPPVYFLTTSGPAQSPTFSNANQNAQEGSTFYTFTPG